MISTSTTLPQPRRNAARSALGSALRWMLLFYVSQLIVVLLVAFVRLDKLHLSDSNATVNTQNLSSIEFEALIDGTDWSLAMLVATISALASVAQSKFKLITHLIRILVKPSLNPNNMEKEGLEKERPALLQESYLGWGFWLFFLLLALTAFYFFTHFNDQFHVKNDIEGTIADQVTNIEEQNRQGQSVSQNVEVLVFKVLHYFRYASVYDTRTSVHITILILVTLFTSRSLYEYLSLDFVNRHSSYIFTRQTKIGFSIATLALVASIILYWKFIYLGQKPKLDYFIEVNTSISERGESVEQSSEFENSYNEEISNPIPFTKTLIPKVQLQLHENIDQVYLVDREPIENAILSKLGTNKLKHDLPCEGQKPITIPAKMKTVVTVEWQEIIQSGEIFEINNRGMNPHAIGTFRAVIGYECKRKPDSAQELPKELPSPQ